MTKDDFAPRQAQEEPQEKIYPLNFINKYVTVKKNELVNNDLATMEAYIRLTDKYKRLLQSFTGALDGRAENTLSGPELNALKKQGLDILRLLNEMGEMLTRKSFIIEDMTNMLEQANPLISKLMYKDNLTLAYNRFFFTANIETMLGRVDENGVTLAFIDIDSFRDFNTQYGHHFGDAVLKEFCYLTAEELRRDPRLYLIRVGGDEFLILGDGVDRKLMRDILQNLLKKVAEKNLEYKGRVAHIHISIGVANSVKDGVQDYLRLYNLADNRLYAAKDFGKNRIVGL